MPSKTVQIRAALLVDGITTSAKVNQAILVTDERIHAVGHQEEIAKQTPPDAQLINLGDACLAPGLIDGHTHLSLAGGRAELRSDVLRNDEMMVLTGAMNLQRHLAAGLRRSASTARGIRLALRLRKDLNAVIFPVRVLW